MLDLIYEGTRTQEVSVNKTGRNINIGLFSEKEFDTTCIFS
jgi:hypothetical protein